jgi:hypothetical protein
MFGYSATCVGDVNGDGFADLAIGAPAGDTGFTGNPSSAYVYAGGPGGVSPTPVALDSPDGPAFEVSYPSVNFGASVAGAGDVDGDGFADVAVITPSASRLHVYSGGAAGVSTTGTTIQVTFGAGNFIGMVTRGGDVNGDGFADVVVGVSGEDYFLPGSASGLSATPHLMGDRGDVMSVAIGD